MRIIKSFYGSNNFVHDFGGEKMENLIMCMVMKFIFFLFLIWNNNQQ